MSINPLNDISRVYMEKIVESSHLETNMKKRAEENEKAREDMKKTKAYQDMAAAARKKFDEAAKPDYLDFDGDGNKKESMKKALKDKAKQKMEEAKKPNDGNLANNYPPYDKVTRGDVIAGALGKDEMGDKKKPKVKVEEKFSNWREDLIEVVDKVKENKGEGPKIVEKKVDNTIKINPPVSEAVKNLGGELIEMVEIEDFEGVLDELSESEIFLLSDQLIEEIVEEFFHECIVEGYDIEEAENLVLESLEVSSSILNEAKVTLGHDTKIKSDRLEKVKSAVKKVARGIGHAAGAAVRGARAIGREVRSGYSAGRSGSSQASSSSSSTSGSSTGSSRPGLLGRIGSALKSGLKKAVAKGARAVSRGARNVARRMEGGEKKEAPKAAPKKAEKPADPWEGSASTPPKAKAKTKKAAAPKAKAAAKPAVKKKKTSKLDDLLASVRSDTNEEIQIDEKTLTAAEKKKREEIAQSMSLADFEKRYPGRGMQVKMATATKMAKKIAEQAMEIQPKTQKTETPQPQQDQKSKAAAQKAKQTAINLKQRELQALRSTPAGTQVAGFGG